jgi:hypothetical protein
METQSDSLNGDDILNTFRQFELKLSKIESELTKQIQINREQDEKIREQRSVIDSLRHQIKSFSVDSTESSSTNGEEKAAWENVEPPANLTDIRHSKRAGT